MALAKNAKVELIRAVPLFAGLSSRELAQVAAIADEIDLPKGKVLMRQGDRGREFFVLLEGTADVTRNGRTINTMRPMDFFGEIALVSHAPRTATVTTASPGRALVVSEQGFRALMDRSPQIQLKVLRTLAERLAATTL